MKQQTMGKLVSYFYFRQTQILQFWRLYPYTLDYQAELGILLGYKHH
jgi:hypothetical protein